MTELNKNQNKSSKSLIFHPVVECTGRTVLTGLASFWFVFSTTHFLQKPIKNRIKYPVAGSLFVSLTLAGTATYFVTKDYYEKFSALKTDEK